MLVVFYLGFFVAANVLKNLTLVQAEGKPSNTESVLKSFQELLSRAEYKHPALFILSLGVMPFYSFKKILNYPHPIPRVECTF
jgi:hypothetical protein